MDVDFGLAVDCIDHAGRPHQLRFTRTQHLAETGQLLAVIDDHTRADNGRITTLSRPGVNLRDVEAALDGWQDWARIDDYRADLEVIRQRIAAAGLTA